MSQYSCYFKRTKAFGYPKLLFFFLCMQNGFGWAMQCFRTPPSLPTWAPVLASMAPAAQRLLSPQGCTQQCVSCVEVGAVRIRKGTVMGWEAAVQIPCPKARNSRALPGWESLLQVF